MSGAVEEAVGAVVGELEALAERIGDLAYDELRRAVEAGESGRPELERRLSRARAAVERAAGLLRG